MDFQIYLEGEDMVAPLKTMNPKDDGWGRVVTPRNGVVLKFSTAESNAGGAFVSETTLREWLTYLDDAKSRKVTYVETMGTSSYTHLPLGENENEMKEDKNNDDNNQ